MTFQYLMNIDEAEWATETLKSTGKPVAVTMPISPQGDVLGKVNPGEAAVRLAKMGKVGMHGSSIHSSVSQSQSVSQTIRQSASQSVRQSVSQAVSQSGSQLVRQSFSETVS